jgi:glycosyltransferase involved in cell wall biosynthesis
VKFLGWASEEALASEYRAADIFVYPSLYEGFGLPVVEAMASGTPVVASTAGAIPETAGDAALLVDPYDVDALAAAIRRIAESGPLAADLRERGLKRVGAFSWQASAAAHAAVYRDLVTQ